MNLFIKAPGVNNKPASQHLYVPGLAHRRGSPFDMGSADSLPRDDFDYRSYKFVGRFAVDPASDADSSDMRTKARAKYGPRVDVFKTARYWVVYEIA